MIKNITIENYKLFKSFHLEDIPRILLIGGKNNCGKTSLLEAIFFILGCGDPGTFFKPLRWRKLETISNTAGSLFAPAFYNFDLNQIMKFQYTLGSSNKELSYKFLPLFKRATLNKGKGVIEISKNMEPIDAIEISYLEKGNHQKSVLQIGEGPNLNIELTNGKQMSQYNNHTSAAFLSATVPLSSREKAEIYGEIDRLNNTEEILKALQEIEPKLQSLTTISVGGNPIIYGDIGIGKKIPLSLMGQGIEHLLSILLHFYIPHIKNGIVLIDEMENGFHHSILSFIWEVIAKHAEANNVQIMATTHNRELIMGAVEGIPEDIRNGFKYIRIDRDKEKNKFDVKHYNFAVMTAALESEFEVR